MRLAERKFVQLALQVLLAAVLVDANQTVRKDAEEAFARVGSHQFIALATGVSLGGLVHGLMLGELCTHCVIEPAFVGMQLRRAGGVAHQRVGHVLAPHLGDRKGSGRAATFHQREDRALLGCLV